MSTPKRVGVMVPSPNIAVEPDFYRALPPSVTAHAHRLWIPPGNWTTPGSDAQEVERHRVMNEDIDVAVRYLMTAPIDIIAYACTAGSFMWGYGGENDVAQRIETASGRPAIVTTAALLLALRTFGVRRLMVASPYPEATNRDLRDFLIAGGFDVLAIRTDPKGSTGSHAMGAETPEEILEFVSRNCVPGSELVLCPSTAWRAFEAAPELEQQLGIPVVTSNQATIWATLARLGLASEVAGHGSIFALPTPNAAIRS